LSKDFEKKWKETAKEVKAIKAGELRTNLICSMINHDSALDQRDEAYEILHRLFKGMSPYQLAGALIALTKGKE
jgi:hypothetical protein